MSGPDRLDFTDPAAVRAWLVDLRVAVDDAEAVAEDMLRPSRRRNLGHVEHQRLYSEAKGQLAQLLDYAGPSGGEPESGDTGPAH